MVPPVEMIPAVSSESLRVIGTPCSAPRNSPRAASRLAEHRRRMHGRGALCDPLPLPGHQVVGLQICPHVSTAAQGLGTCLGGRRRRQVISRGVHQNDLIAKQHRFVLPCVMAPKGSPCMRPLLLTRKIETLYGATDVGEADRLAVGHR